MVRRWTWPKFARHARRIQGAAATWRSTNLSSLRSVRHRPAVVLQADKWATPPSAVQVEVCARAHPHTGRYPKVTEASLTYAGHRRMPAPHTEAVRRRAIKPAPCGLPGCSGGQSVRRLRAQAATTMPPGCGRGRRVASAAHPGPKSRPIRRPPRSPSPAVATLPLTLLRHHQLPRTVSVPSNPAVIRRCRSWRCRGTIPPGDLDHALIHAAPPSRRLWVSQS